MRQRRSPDADAAFRRAVDDAKQRYDISAIVARDRKVTRAGKNEKRALCAFHSERTPSMQLNDAKGTFHCFACSASGDIVTVMAVAQLSRDLERRPDKRPMPSDLRDSGQIEQDADLILFVYREEEYLRRNEPQDQFGAKYEAWRTDMEAVRNRIEFLVPKRRSGPTGKALGWFFGANSAVRGSDFFQQPNPQDAGADQ